MNEEKNINFHESGQIFDTIKLDWKISPTINIHILYTLACREREKKRERGTEGRREGEREKTLGFQSLLNLYIKVSI